MLFSTQNPKSRQVLDCGEWLDVNRKPVATGALPAECDGAVWVDYIADLGDGFETTRAMAYLLDANEVKVASESAHRRHKNVNSEGGYAARNAFNQSKTLVDNIPWFKS